MWVFEITNLFSRLLAEPITIVWQSDAIAYVKRRLLSWITFFVILVMIIPQLRQRALVSAAVCASRLW